MIILIGSNTTFSEVLRCILHQGLGTILTSDFQKKNRHENLKDIYDRTKKRNEELQVLNKNNFYEVAMLKLFEDYEDKLHNFSVSNATKLLQNAKRLRHSNSQQLLKDIEDSIRLSIDSTGPFRLEDRRLIATSDFFAIERKIYQMNIEAQDSAGHKSPVTFEV